MRCSELKRVIPTVIGWAVSSVVMVRTKRKSFQTAINERMAAAKTPGAVKGTITYQRACKREAPSIRAASSRSGGRSRKNEDINQIDSGKVRTRSGIIRAA